MRRLLAAALLATFLAAACLSRPPAPIDPLPALEDGATRFVAFGDAGTGEPPQERVAQAMEAVCRARGCDFALMLGDNIYDSGASSPDDPQFEEKFEEPYAAFSIPFYAVLGNHDNSGGPGGDPGLGSWHEAGDHQVAYSYRTDRASDKWRMPARHYEANLGNVSLLALDTNTLVYGDVRASGAAAPTIDGEAAWVGEALANSTAPWRLAMGHHPYVSNGEHGNAGVYDGVPAPGLSGDRLKAFFEGHLCGRVDLYLAGHDHNLQWLEPVPACGRTEFVVSGGGGAGTYSLPGGNEAAFQRETRGFWWFEATPTTLRGVAYDDQGQALFERTLAK